MVTQRRPRGRPLSFDREAALEQAMMLFWRHGYEATSVADLVAVMGITPPSLYAAFGDKQKLFLEAAELYLARQQEALDQVLDQAPSARQAIAELLRNVAVTLAQPDLPCGCMLVTAALSGSTASLEVQATLSTYRRSNQETIAAFLQRAVLQGELGSATDTKALASFFITVIRGMSVQVQDGATLDDLLATGDAAMAAWPGGLP